MIISVIVLLFLMFQIFKRYFSPTVMVSESTKSKVQELINQHKVFVASKTYCPYCSATKKLLDEIKADPYVIELDTTEEGNEIQAALLEITGQRTVPNVFISGKHIGGNSDLQALYKNGQLTQALKA